MSTRGTRTDVSGYRGWVEDPDRPGIEMYWDGDGFASDIPPRSKPPTMWQEARTVALGVLMALAVVAALFMLGAV